MLDMKGIPIVVALGLVACSESAAPPVVPQPSAEERAQEAAASAVRAMFEKARQSEALAKPNAGDRDGSREQAYGQLMRKGDRAAGTLFPFHGEVMQVSDRDDGGTTLLVATKRHGRGRHAMWAGNIVLIETPARLPAPEGIVAGSEVYGVGVFAQLHTYPTQAGGSNTVPNVLARYVHPAW